MEDLVNASKNTDVNENQCTAMISSDGNNLKWITVQCNKTYSNVRYICEKRCNDSSEYLFVFNYTKSDDDSKIGHSLWTKRYDVECMEGWFAFSENCYRVYRIKDYNSSSKDICEIEAELAHTLPDELANEGICSRKVRRSTVFRFDLSDYI